MKNSASEIFCLGTDHAVAYQHAFGYIRQLAIHLRNSMKVKSKVSFAVSVHRFGLVHPRPPPPHTLFNFNSLLYS